MNTLMYHYQHISDTLQNMFLLINGFLHLLFAGAVAKDSGKFRNRGLETILVSPTTWAFTALIGGVWAAGLYWFLHHSTLTYATKAKQEPMS